MGLLYIKSFETPKVRSYLGTQLLVAILCSGCLAVQVQVLKFHLSTEEGRG